MLPLQSRPAPGSAVPEFAKPKSPPRRKHRRLVHDWLLARAVETIGDGATPCAYLCARLNAGATTRDLALEGRAWVAANRSGKASETFPGRFYIDRYALRALHGELGTPDRNAIEAAQKVSHAISASRTGARLTAGRAAARARRLAQNPLTTPLDNSSSARAAMAPFSSDPSRGSVRPNLLNV